MTEADAEDALAHGVERPEEGAEAEDPPLVAVRVVRAAAHHEPLVPPHLLRRRELAVDHPEAVPSLLLPSAAAAAAAASPPSYAAFRAELSCSWRQSRARLIPCPCKQLGRTIWAWC